MPGLMEFGLISSFVPMLVWMLIVPFVIVYILADVHGRRVGERDPNLGAKVLFSLLLSVCAQIALTGLALFFATLFDSDLDGDMRKTALALIVAGVSSSAFPIAFWSRLQGMGSFNMGQKALGINAIVTGLVFVTAFTVFVVMLFNGENVGAPLAITLVYGAASAGAAAQLTR